MKVVVFVLGVIVGSIICKIEYNRKELDLYFELMECELSLKVTMAHVTKINELFRTRFEISPSAKPLKSDKNSVIAIGGE